MTTPITQDLPWRVFLRRWLRLALIGIAIGACFGFGSNLAGFNHLEVTLGTDLLAAAIMVLGIPYVCGITNSLDPRELSKLKEII